MFEIDQMTYGGRGTICEEVLPNGDVYIGNFDGLLPQGTGIYTWLDGTTYDGEWEKSKMSGRGCIRWPSGAAYEGEISGGFLHGTGVYSGSDGSKYDGDWRMNIQHGFGSKIYCNSDIYKGSWTEGLQEGMGRYVWNSGNIYVGNWKSGKMCGTGLMKWANGDLFEGFWLDGLEHGHGYYKFADGSYYVGTWSKGLKDGKGMFYPAGCKHPFLKQLNDPSELLKNWQSHTKFTSASTPESNMCLKCPLVGFMRRSGRISHRSGTIDGGWILDGPVGDSSQQINLKHSSSSSGDKDFLVYEREYAQGVLITEKAVHPDCTHPEQNKLKLRCLLEKPRKPCKTIIKGDRSFYLMLNLQLGIRYTVGKITPVPKREVRSSDFGPRARIRMYFPSHGSEFTPPHHSIGFTWKDYCPMVFRNLREMFRIDAADYMVSACGTDGLKELSSPGKSGSIFYLSQDERFVLKSLKKSELKILLKMLPRYYSHVSEHENTLITKFFGLHQITLKVGRKVRFVVMGNMFCTELRIHRRYDLKGSSQGRSTKKCKIDENTTQKDLDLSYVFLLEKSWREALFKQIYLDCKFLESQRIIDYSLLLGLHFRAPEHSKDLSEIQNLPQKHSGLSTNHDETAIPRKGLCLVTHDPDSVNMMPGSHIRGSTLRASAIGGQEADLLLPDTGRLRVQLGVNMPAQANPKVLHEAAPPRLLETNLFEIYDVVLYFGVIDVLQEYNMTKKLEHAMKSLKFDPLSISAVKPSLYSRRFIRFLEKVFPEQL